MSQIDAVVLLSSSIFNLACSLRYLFLGYLVFPDARLDVLLVPLVKPTNLCHHYVNRIQRSQFNPSKLLD